MPREHDAMVKYVKYEKTVIILMVTTQGDEGEFNPAVRISSPLQMNDEDELIYMSLLEYTYRLASRSCKI